MFVEKDLDAALRGLNQAPDFETSKQDGDFAEVFRRLQHVGVKDFHVGIYDSPFLNYWKKQEAAFFTVMCIDFGPPETTDYDLVEFAPPETTDYDLVDFIVNRLRPRTTSNLFE